MIVVVQVGAAQEGREKWRWRPDKTGCGDGRAGTIHVQARRHNKRADVERKVQFQVTRDACRQPFARRRSRAEEKQIPGEG